MSTKDRLLKDYTGRSYGSLVVEKFAGRDKGRKALWLCRCACGGTITVQGSHLNNGSVISCGHIRREKAVLNLPTSTYGRPTAHPLYAVWNNMINRCYNPKNTHYHRYGGRGISVCARWRYYANFYDDLLPLWAEGLVIDRRDNDGHYWPSNVRFVTHKVSANNKSPRTKKSR